MQTGLKKRQMTKEESKIFIVCYMQEEKMNQDPELMKLLESKENYSSVLWNRLKRHTVDVSPAVCLFLGYHIESFGISTMIANYLQYVAYKHNVKKIGMKEIGEIVFPLGFPTEETWRELWDMQKADDGGNILDDAACGESIRLQYERSKE